MRRGVLAGALSMLAATAATLRIAAAAPPGAADADVPALLAAALPADGSTDIVLVDWPAAKGAPHVRAATACAAAPAVLKSVLLDSAELPQGRSGADSRRRCKQRRRASNGRLGD